MKRLYLIGSALVLAAVVLGGCGATKPALTSTGTVKQENGQSVREFTVVAKTAKHELTSGQKIDAWTFNGSVPGTPIRVNQGDRVRVTLKNELPEPVTIHWHGMRVPNTMDGIPGVTQNAVQPKGSFVYEFEAKDAGTYWYHSHQDGSNQLDKGLYGSIIVDPKEQAVRYDRDYTLVLDEWMTGNGDDGGMNGMSGMSGMDHGSGSSMPAGQGDDMMSMYNVFTINGKSASAVPALEVKKGERVKLRLINAGYQTHYMHLHGHSFKVTHTDGQAFAEPTVLKDTLVAVAPGERYDLDFIADNTGTWYLENHSDNKAATGMKVAIRYTDGGAAAADPTTPGGQLPTFDLTSYGSLSQAPFTRQTQFDVNYTMELGANMAPGQGEVFTLNGKAYPNTEPVKVRKGDKVKVRLVNTTNVDHPMHLHGHFFQVLTRNGKPVTGTPIMKDTINVRPGEEYEIAFLAEEPGNWMFHCHELHHAASGMVTLVMYDGFVPAFTPDPKANNKPE